MKGMRRVFLGDFSTSRRGAFQMPMPASSSERDDSCERKPLLVPRLVEEGRDQSLAGHWVEIVFGRRMRFPPAKSRTIWTFEDLIALAVETPKSRMR